MSNISVKTKIVLIALSIFIIAASDKAGGETPQYLHILTVQEGFFNTAVDIAVLENAKIYCIPTNIPYTDKFRETCRKLRVFSHSTLPIFIAKNWQESHFVRKEVIDSIVFGSFKGVFFIGKSHSQIVETLWERICEKSDEEKTYSIGIVSLPDSFVTTLRVLCGMKTGIFYPTFISASTFFARGDIPSAGYLTSIGEVQTLSENLLIFKLFRGNSINKANTVGVWTDNAEILEIPLFVSYMTTEKDTIIKLPILESVAAVAVEPKSKVFEIIR